MIGIAVGDPISLTLLDVDQPAVKSLACLAHRTLR